jgi:hypothetical protein
VRVSPFCGTVKNAAQRIQYLLSTPHRRFCIVSQVRRFCIVSKTRLRRFGGTA